MHAPPVDAAAPAKMRRAAQAMLAMQVRPAVTRDITRVLPLWEMLAAFHADLDPAFAVEGGAAREYSGHLRDILDHEDACLMLGLEDDEVVAFALGRVQTLPLPFRARRRGWIQDVFTVPRRRREGIGRRVVEALLAWFARRGVTLVELTVATQNAGAVEFWRRLGFETYMYRMKRSAEGDGCSTSAR